MSNLFIFCVGPFVGPSVKRKGETFCVPFCEGLDEAKVSRLVSLRVLVVGAVFLGLLPVLALFPNCPPCPNMHISSMQNPYIALCIQGWTRNSGWRRSPIASLC